jgi:hypothetical protein
VESGEVLWGPWPYLCTAHRAKEFCGQADGNGAVRGGWEDGSEAEVAPCDAVVPVAFAPRLRWERRAVINELKQRNSVREERRVVCADVENKDIVEK